MYFNKFNKMLYDFDIKNEKVVLYLTDITRNIRFRTDILSNMTVYDEYDIQDSDTPESIADKFYNNPNYHWIIMLANDRHHYINDFPLSYSDLQQFILDKYGNAINAIHHYENDSGFIVDASYTNSNKITNSDYEFRLNEAKRTIKIIPSELINQILKQYNELL